MTTQEAIYYIKETKRTLDCSEFSLYLEQALGMAIEALSAQEEQDVFTIWAKSVADSQTYWMTEH